MYTIMIMITRLVWQTLLLIGALWILDAAVDSFVFHQETFVQQIAHPSSQEVYLRVVGIGFLIALGYCRFLVYKTKQAEEALMKSQTSLAEAQRIAHLGSWEWNIQTDEVSRSVEACLILGLSPKDYTLSKKLINRYIQPEDRELIRTSRQKALTEGTPYSIDFRLLHPNGERKVVHTEAEVHHDKDGTPIRMVGTLHDITERVRAEEELQHHREELSHVSRVETMAEMAASVAHELNQPLTAILTNAQFLHRVLATDKRAKELDGALEDIIDNSKRAGEIIRRQRHFLSRGERERSPLDINELIRGLEIFTRADIQKNKVKLVLDLAADLAKTNGDRIQIEQVLLNLIRNGMESMQELDNEGRELVVKTSMSEPNVIMVGILDTGPPINDEVFEQLFEPFYSTKASGLGMGLSISRSLIESHGGRLWASRNEDQGITMCLTLPRKEGESSYWPRPTAADEPRALS